MKSRDFCFWLQGFLEMNPELGESAVMSMAQINSLRAHLNLVFAHEIDPSAGDKKEQDKLNAIHSPSTELIRC